MTTNGASSTRTTRRTRRLFALVSLFVLLLVAELLPIAAARQSDSGSTAHRPVFDGRGLATFGDRALTPFSDRFDASFGYRPIDSVAPVGLAPMGGMQVPSSVDARQPNTLAPTAPPAPELRHHHRLHWRCLSQPFGFVETAAATPSANGASATAPADQTVSLLGVTVAEPATTPAVVVLPTVKLPAVKLDHRGALATIESTLRQELADARARGDVDLARSLAERLER